MAEARPGRRTGSRRGRQRRPPTWEISDSDAEGAAAPEVAAEGQGAAEKSRAAARALRSDQVLKRLAVCVDPAVLEDAGSDILMEALGALGCECRIEPQRLARSLQWSGGWPDPDTSAVPPELCNEDECEQLLLLEPQEFLRGAAQLTQNLECAQVLPSLADLGEEELVSKERMTSPPSNLPWLSAENPARPHLAVIGLDTYLWSHQPSVQKRQQLERTKEAHANVTISWPEVEEALVLLQLYADVHVLLVDSWQELSQHVCAFTKALSQRPSKQYRDSQAFPFCTAGRWASGLKVTRDGSGLRGVWLRQIGQFNRVSPAVADAVITAFPSPRLLQQALMACSTEQERLGLLADLPVKTLGDGQSRRVGPDLSRRICLFLTTTNPDLLLDLAS